jgi:hypothetical protein
VTILLIIGLGGIVLLLLAAAVLVPGKSPALSGISTLAEPLRPVPPPSSHDSPSRDPDAEHLRYTLAQLHASNSQSLRDRQLDEEAAAIAGEYRRISNERYLDSLRSDAAAYFSAPTTAKKSAT